MIGDKRFLLHARRAGIQRALLPEEIPCKVLRVYKSPHVIKRGSRGEERRKTWKVRGIIARYVIVVFVL